ncbi:hypothetical protein C0J52_08542 [Blattella germanica]|nr:hypothetical protein C0J52_08542 [Blattella germanica]
MHQELLTYTHDILVLLLRNTASVWLKNMQTTPWLSLEQVVPSDELIVLAKAVTKVHVTTNMRISEEMKVVYQDLFVLFKMMYNRIPENFLHLIKQVQIILRHLPVVRVRCERNIWPQSLRNVTVLKLSTYTATDISPYVEYCVQFWPLMKTFHFWYGCTNDTVARLEENCKEVEEVSFAHSKRVTDGCLQQLCSFSKLKHMDISFTSVSTWGFKKIVTTLPKSIIPKVYIIS